MHKSYTKILLSTSLSIDFCSVYKRASGKLMYVRNNFKIISLLFCDTGTDLTLYEVFCSCPGSMWRKYQTLQEDKWICYLLWCLSVKCWEWSHFCQWSSTNYFVPTSNSCLCFSSGSRQNLSEWLLSVI